MSSVRSYGVSVKSVCYGFTLIGLLTLTLTGCSTPTTASKNVALSNSPTVTVAKVQPIATNPKRTVTLVEKVVWNAQKQQGKMYRWGGTSPVTGFDCSGLTQYAFNKGAGVAIPRTAAEQYKAAMKIPASSAQKGDLVFFNTYGKYVSHVGVYLGNNRFLHAPRTGRAITTSSLQGYWQERLVGFGRFPAACRPAFS